MTHISLRSELYRGIAARWYKYVPLLLICAAFYAEFYHTSRLLMEQRHIEVMPSMLDYLLRLFSGMEIYQRGAPFAIPYVLLAPCLYIALITASYPTRDLAGFGRQILLRSNGRSYWYLSKCVWCVSHIMVCFLVIYVTAFAFSVLSANVTFAASGKPMEMLLLADYGTADTLNLALSVSLSPFMAILALSMLQVFLEFVLKPIFSFAVIVCIWVASSYLYTPALIGNFAMLLRSSLALGEQGLYVTQGVVSCLCVCIISIVSGVFYFSRRSIFE